MNILKQILTGILTLESRLIIRKYKPFIVAITGSVGKTTTKDAIYDVLKGHSQVVRKTEKSLNSEIGLPLTIIGMPNAWYNILAWMNIILAGLKLILTRQKYPDCLVLEIGADHPGDIRSVVRWLKPDIAVLTRVSRTPVHVEFFSSSEEVLEEKVSLIEGIKSGGTAILFADDDNTLSVGGRMKDRDVSVVSYGLGQKAEVRGTNASIVYEGSVPTGMSFDLYCEGNSYPIMIRGVIGDAYVYPILVAVAVGRAKNIGINDIVKSAGAFVYPKGRMNILEGINDSIIIDDTYNSSPDAVSSALQVMKNVQCTGSKIAVLGDMMELGKHSSDEHRKIGRELVGVVDKIITVGQRSKLTAEEALASGFSAEGVQSFSLSSEVIPVIAGMVKSGDVVLVKGSQSVRMERVTASLLRRPERAGELLVRQEQVWLDKK